MLTQLPTQLRALLACRGHRDEAGMATVVWFLLFFLPFAMLITIPIIVDTSIRANATARFENCVGMAALGVRLWAAENYITDDLPNVNLGAAKGVAEDVFARSTCNGVNTAAGLGPWSVDTVTMPYPGTFNVTVSQRFISPYGVDFFRDSNWQYTAQSLNYAYGFDPYNQS